MLIAMPIDAMMTSLIVITITTTTTTNGGYYCSLAQTFVGGSGPQVGAPDPKTQPRRPSERQRISRRGRRLGRGACRREREFGRARPL